MGVQRRIVLLLFLLVLVLGCGQKEEEDRKDSITVFCGSANKPAMEEIAVRFEQERGIRVNMIFGGSGTLLSQIELSKQGEIYLPGSPDYVLIAERKKLVIEKSDRIVAYLIPAIITPAGNPANIQSLQDLARAGVRIGIGNPETVCLGLYGVEILERNDLLVPVLKNVVTFGGSCSKTANLAAMNKVDAILGWRDFHFWNPERMTYVPIAPQKIPRISYINMDFFSNTNCLIAAKESTTSANPIMATPEELITAPPKIKSRPFTIGPLKSADRIGGCRGHCSAGGSAGEKQRRIDAIEVFQVIGPLRNAGCICIKFGGNDRQTQYRQLFKDFLRPQVAQIHR